MRAYERLLNYVKFNTESDEDSLEHPSTEHVPEWLCSTHEQRRSCMQGASWVPVELAFQGERQTTEEKQHILSRDTEWHKEN